MEHEAITTKGQNRYDWELVYTAEKLRNTCAAQIGVAMTRIEQWQKLADEVMDKIKRGGIHVGEDIAEALANYTRTLGGPQVQIDQKLVKELTDSAKRLEYWKERKRQLEAWGAMFREVGPNEKFRLKPRDWMFFFNEGRTI